VPLLAEHRPEHEQAVLLAVLGIWSAGVYLWYVAWMLFKKEKIYIWPFNFCISFVLAIELQNRIFLTIQLLKTFTIGHRAVLMGGFNFFIYNLVLRTSNDHYFLVAAPI
jgi:hypothetical protein